LKTTQLPTRLALPKSAFTSPHDCQATAFLLTCVYQARNGPSASPWSELSQNRVSRALVMIRTPSLRRVRSRQLDVIVDRKTRTVNRGVRILRTTFVRQHETL